MSDGGHYRILIVGCGELGSRHLQAVSSLPQVRAIEVVDPRPEALALGHARVSDVGNRPADLTFLWLSSLDQASHGGDLCVVATQAKGRCDVVREVAAIGYSAFLLEKCVSRSRAEYDALLAFSHAHNLRAWVNCKRRAYPISKRIKERLDPAEPIVFAEIGGNHGLANNGIHAADLFAFYDGSPCIESAGSKIDPVLHPSKRGPNVFDVAGTLHAYSDKGSHFVVSYAASHMAPPHTTVATSQYRWMVDEMSRTAWESDASTGWAWRAVPFEGDLKVSTMTRTFAAEILATGTCELPTLAECAPAHRFVLDELLPSFQRLADPRLDYCPIA